MRKALIVGIDYYENVSCLHGCVNDAHSVKAIIERHGDGTINFGVNLITATGPDSQLKRRELKDNIQKLFNDDSDIALFYFAGHGYIESSGGYLITSECEGGDDGLSLNELMLMANESKAKSKVIILDSCHSGILGNLPAIKDSALLAEGVTILTASSSDQYAQEINGSGVFTSLLVDAMSGGSSNLVGDITPASIYAHIDQSLGPWEQRPIFKTNVKNFTTLRKVHPPIQLCDLKKIIEIFEDPSVYLQLDPSYEPTSESANEINTDTFSILQKYVKVNLVTPVDAEHMYYAAIESKQCKLTVLGAHYWKLVKKERI
ncbi:caspase family protein [Photobacterium angustum]|uniref:caspase family protein n=1 Tax=Photobacterium angustum TaxID=661 RepID=UPI0005E4BDE6|nr:caspase family protein [Photobacterium angustum]KJG18387.1 peptidase C14 [Photobacterium angustum]KJG20869.1 peptidase C14 [Photobacterium angustum]KJG29261.1 peptidase C14 [Photobacterium angustum]PSW95335.1 caspase family protein [Photobacterium angustum]PSX04149.1 caspase family protein [Photobacterium angustum]